jgi:hypothetical protein
MERRQYKRNTNKKKNKEIKTPPFSDDQIIIITESEL